MFFRLAVFSSFALLSACAGGKGGGASSDSASSTTSPRPSAPVVAPLAPTITSPASSPFRSNTGSLTVSGGCTSGNLVTLEGDSSQTTGCVNGTYSLVVGASADGTYNYSVKQANLAGISPATALVWVLDTTAPSPLILTSPASSPIYTNQSTLTFSGSCESGATVSWVGAATGSTTCVSSAFSFNITMPSDGNYALGIAQVDGAGNISPTLTQQWILDTAAPAAPTVVNPASSPYLSSGSSLTLSGGCETGATVNLSGDGTANAVCASAAYSFSVNQSVDGTYNYSLSQVDAAGNVSPSSAVQWTRNSSIPATPSIVAPSANPDYSSSSTLTISGSCTTGNSVILGGSMSAGEVLSPMGSLTRTCSASAYSFTLSKSADGTYNFTIKQNNGVTDSASASLQWVRDTLAPAAPTVTTPASNPYSWNGSNLAVSGACETGATVSLSGDASGSVVCNASAYSFNVNKMSDGTYNFTLSQSDAAGNTSGTASFQWMRDTMPPVAPTITSPASSPYYSNSSSITLSGACESGATVTLGGSSSATTACVGSAYSFSIAEGSDATYNFSVSQTDAAGNISSSSSAAWVRITSTPSTPTITTPATSPAFSNTTPLTIVGACTTGYLVKLSGDATDSQTCASSAYSFGVNPSVDGTYNYSVVQNNQVADSAAATLTLTLDRVAPTAPAVTSPATSSYISNSDNLTISGSCEAGATINLSGASTASASCTSGSFSFPVSQTTDGTYNYSLAQTDQAGNISPSASVQWTRNTAAPAAPTITTPATNPYSSSGSSLTISGSCLTGATVNLSGAASASTSCVGSSYTFSVNKSTDGTYNFSVTEIDAAGNVSQAATVQWNRISTAPSAPTITTPTSSPAFSNSTALTIAGGCTTGNLVKLSGDATASQTCASSAYSFSLNVSADGSYSYSVVQNNSVLDSPAAALSWTLDRAAPVAPTMTTPPTTSYFSNGNNLTISGACESGATVNLSGASSASVGCSGGSYSFSVSQSSDGAYNYSVSQVDRAGNASPPTSLQWTRDSVAPSAPTISNPGSNPYYSSGISMIISGACEAGAAVQLTGDASGVTSCTSSAYSFSIPQSVDGTYNFSIYQIDAAGNASASVAQQWVRNSAIPAAPSISAPAASPYSSNGSSLTISGSCVTGYLVSLSGDITSSEVSSPAGSMSQYCASSSFSFTLSKSVDGTYNFSLKENNGVTDSAAASVQWIRDTVAPAVPTVTSPASNPYHSNGNSVSISGACETGATVTLGGASTASTTCTSSTYSLSVNSTADGNHDYTLSQTDAAGNASPILNFRWIRDTIAPAAPTITAPSSNPFTSGDTALTISGACETGATVSLSGAATGTTVCSASAYSFNVSQNVDGSYSYSLTQTDVAGNVSAAQSFQWDRDTTIPATPVIVTPSVYPYYSNGSSLTISGSCIDGYLVNLSGSASSQVTCTGAAFSFTVNASADGIYTYGIDQQATSSTPNSAQATVQWIRDTSTPATPTITNPSTNPYTSSGNLTIAGACETGATVNLAGSDAQTTTCASSSYSFTVTKSTDGTYNFTISQTDKSGNISATASLQWTRDTSIPVTPTITTPAITPYSSSSSSLTLAGGCQTGAQVNLSGDVAASDVTSPAGSLSETCSNSSYQFVIAKSADRTYNFNLTQSDTGGTSGATTQTWTRDTTAPGVTITSSPAATNLALTASFAFSSTDATATFQCQLDTAAYATCASPMTYSGLANGAHTFKVVAVDPVGNVTATPASYSWTQAAYNTIALYHFDSGSSMIDSSSYTGGENNALSNSGTATTASGKFADGELFAQASSQSMSAASNNSQQLGTGTMTIETWVKFTTLPSTNGETQVIASKNGASGNMGWEFKLKKQGSNYLMVFGASTNGTSMTSVNSTSCNMDTTSFHHLAVTWNKGSVKFFCDGVARGTGTIGTAGTSTIFKSTASLILGRTQTMSSTVKYLNATMDEFRLSSVVRWTGNFTVPSSAYSPD